jgi:hypothetical protein
MQAIAIQERSVDFQISGLSVDNFSDLFGQDLEALARLGVLRVVADSKPGFPCRVSLRDAEIGENVLLLNYEHQRARSPYRSSHAIYVRESAEQAALAVNEVPEMLRRRLLSVRAFDDRGMMLTADLIQGKQLEYLIDTMLADNAARYLHIHNARPGCYAALVKRSENQHPDSHSKKPSCDSENGSTESEFG